SQTWKNGLLVCAICLNKTTTVHSTLSTTSEVIFSVRKFLSLLLKENSRHYLMVQPHSILRLKSIRRSDQNVSVLRLTTSLFPLITYSRMVIRVSVLRQRNKISMTTG